MSENTDLGKGIKYPFALSSSGATAKAEQMEHLGVSIIQRLMTRKGERIIRPWFGSNLQDLLDLPINQETLALMRYEIYEALKDEDRLDIKSIIITSEEKAQLNISIECVIGKDVQAAFAISYDREMLRWEGQWL